MLLKNKDLELIKKGKLSVVFRVWKRPTVKNGGTLTTRQGVLLIDKVEKIDRDSVTEEDLNRIIVRLKWLL